MILYFFVQLKPTILSIQEIVFSRQKKTNCTGNECKFLENLKNICILSLSVTFLKVVLETGFTS